MLFRTAFVPESHQKDKSRESNAFLGIGLQSGAADFLLSRARNLSDFDWPILARVVIDTAQHLIYHFTLGLLHVLDFVSVARHRMRA